MYQVSDALQATKFCPYTLILECGHGVSEVCASPRYLSTPFLLPVSVSWWALQMGKAFSKGGH